MIDARVHHALLAGIVRTGHAPAAYELAAALGVSAGDVDAALHRLADGHGLLLHPGTSRVWVAHPFALSPTGTWVAAGDRGWWAPCTWCAFGIVALVGGDAVVHARVGGEARPIELRVRDGALDDDAAVVHFALPPRAAWDNVVHWCASVQPFTDAAEVAPWCARHGYRPGEIVPVAQVLALGRAWYGGHLDPSWRKHTTAEAQAIFAQVGLTSAFWSLPAGDEPF